MKITSFKISPFFIAAIALWLGCGFISSILLQFPKLKSFSPFGQARGLVFHSKKDSVEPVVNDDTSIPVYGTEKDRQNYSKYANLTGQEKLDTLKNFYGKSWLNGFGAFGVDIPKELKPEDTATFEKIVGALMDYKVKSVVGYYTDNVGAMFDNKWIRWLVPKSFDSSWFSYLGFPIGCAMMCLAPPLSVPYCQHLPQITGIVLALFHSVDCLYLIPRARKNQHWQMLMEVHRPEVDDRKVFHMHLHTDGAGVEVSVKNYGNPAVLNPAIQKVHQVPAEVDITVFQLIERFMRYRVGIRPLRWLYSKDYVPLEGCMDYICQDLIIDAYRVLGLHEGRKHWGGIGKGCLRMLKNPLSPREAWFKHTDEFTDRFLLDSKNREHNLFIEYKPQAQDGLTRGLTNDNGFFSDPERNKQIVVGVLLFLLMICLIIQFSQKEEPSRRCTLAYLEAGRKNGMILE